MAQAQPPAPDYPYPDGVTDEWRNATTPPPHADLFQDGVLQIDPVSDHLLNSLPEIASHGRSNSAKLCAGGSNCQNRLIRELSYTCPFMLPLSD